MPDRPLKVGIQLPEVEREVRWPELLDLVRAIEDLGFDSIWLGEHLLYRWPDRDPRGPWEAWTLMGAIAALTSRVEFGPLVACTNFHNPALLAKQASTIDEISGGRLVLGLGAGWNEVEFRAFGFPFDHRIDRFEEAFTIIRTLLHEGAIDFEGRFYQARDCELLPRSARPGGPPLMIGSKGPRMLAISLPHVDSWNVWYSDTGNTPAGVAPLRAQVDAENARDDAPMRCSILVIDNDPAASGADVARAHGAAYVVEPQPGIAAVRNRALAELAWRQREAAVPRAAWYPQLGVGAQWITGTSNNSTATQLNVPEVDLVRIGGTPMMRDPSWRPAP